MYARQPLPASLPGTGQPATVSSPTGRFFWHGLVPPLLGGRPVLGRSAHLVDKFHDIRGVVPDRSCLSTAHLHRGKPRRLRCRVLTYPRLGYAQNLGDFRCGKEGSLGGVQIRGVIGPRYVHIVLFPGLVLAKLPRSRRTHSGEAVASSALVVAAPLTCRCVEGRIMAGTPSLSHFPNPKAGVQSISSTDNSPSSWLTVE